MKESLPITATRIYGIDLLRLICMLLVCGTHVLGELCTVPSGTVASFWLYFLRALCGCAVNCFAMISGYVSSKNSHRISRLFSLWLIVLFYSVGITLLCGVLTGSVGFSSLLKAFLPVTSEQYWYFSAYFLMFFFIPILNSFCDQASSRQVFYYFAGILIMSVLGVRLNAFQGLWSMNQGFSVFWLLLMFGVGRFLRDGWLKLSIKTAWILWGCAVVLTWLCELLRYFHFLPAALVLPEMLYLYTAPTMILAAISLVSIFSKITIPPSLIPLLRKLSPLAFSVYIIHYHKGLWGLLKERLHFDGRYFLLDAIGFTLLMFLLCLGLDAIRQRLFRAIGISRLAARLELVTDQLCAILFK